MWYSYQQLQCCSHVLSRVVGVLLYIKSTAAVILTHTHTHTHTHSQTHNQKRSPRTLGTCVQIASQFNYFHKKTHIFFEVKTPSTHTQTLQSSYTTLNINVNHRHNSNIFIISCLAGIYPNTSHCRRLCGFLSAGLSEARPIVETRSVWLSERSDSWKNSSIADIQAQAIKCSNPTKRIFFPKLSILPLRFSLQARGWRGIQYTLVLLENVRFNIFILVSFLSFENQIKSIWPLLDSNAHTHAHTQIIYFISFLPRWTMSLLAIDISQPSPHFQWPLLSPPNIHIHS